jgi:hypothetical protein
MDKSMSSSTQTYDSGRRKFLSLFAIIPCGLLIKSFTPLNDLVISNSVMNKFFTSQSERVGSWMIKHLTIDSVFKIIDENRGFINKLSVLANGEIRQMISEDFINDEVIYICNINFSVKEAVLCMFSANYKGNV